MASARDIRSKMASIKKTQKITSAMQMVAASKMRKAQERMQLARPYADKIINVIGHLAQSNTEYRHEFLVQREKKRVAYLVVTTDRGLCGGLNTNLFKAVLKHMKEHSEQGVGIDICLLGSKGDAFFRRLNANIIASARHVSDTPHLTDFVGLVQVLLEAYSNKQIDAIYIASNEFVNTMTQKPQVSQLLPTVPAEDKRLTHHWDYIYEPDAKELLDALLKRYVESRVYRSVVENVASEQAARMVSMKNASENAAQLINQLQLVYNKARQAAITKELAEIVAGAEALA